MEKRKCDFVRHTTIPRLLVTNLAGLFAKEKKDVGSSLSLVKFITASCQYAGHFYCFVSAAGPQGAQRTYDYVIH